MPIEKYRSERGRPYARLDAQTVLNPNLSNAELGLLLRLINLPESWQYSDVGFCHAYHKDGRSALRSQLKSLEAKGYIKRIRRVRNKHGQFTGTALIIREISMHNP